MELFLLIFNLIYYIIVLGLFLILAYLTVTGNIEVIYHQTDSVDDAMGMVKQPKIDSIKTIIINKSIQFGLIIITILFILKSFVLCYSSLMSLIYR